MHLSHRRPPRSRGAKAHQSCPDRPDCIYRYFSPSNFLLEDLLRTITVRSSSQPVSSVGSSSKPAIISIVIRTTAVSLPDPLVVAAEVDLVDCPGPDLHTLLQHYFAPASSIHFCLIVKLTLRNLARAVSSSLTRPCDSEVCQSDRPHPYLKFSIQLKSISITCLLPFSSHFHLDKPSRFSCITLDLITISPRLTEHHLEVC